MEEIEDVPEKDGGWSVHIVLWVFANTCLQTQVDVKALGGLS